MGTIAQQATLDSCSSCLNIHLGDYNLFLLKDYAGSRGVEGKVAAGGNINLKSFSVGSKLPDNDLTNTIVAGGDLTLSEGGVSGDTFYGGTYSADSTVSYNRGAGAKKGMPINFASRFVELRSLSSYLATQQANGTTQREVWGGVYMSGIDPCLNVFDVNASAFNGAALWSIEAPAGSFVVINIRGTSSTFSGFDISPTGGINLERILYNFVDATRIDASGFGFKGTILAPYAHVTFNNGAWDGGIYAVSLTGVADGRIHPLDDEGGECEEGSTTSCTTICGSTGTKVCSSTCSWGACTPPEVEVCNGVDDNCNGLVDEGFECTGSGSRNCTDSCGAKGTQVCNSATCTYGACVSSSCCHADTDCSDNNECTQDVCNGTGTCTHPPVPAGTVCGSGQVCDGEGNCQIQGGCLIGGTNYAAGATNPNGVCQECNPNVSMNSWSFKASTSQCRTAAGVCDVAEYCTGNSATCPADGKQPATTVCRDLTGVCDVAEYCTGISDTCPADGFNPSGVTCTSDSKECTQDACNGTGTCTHPPVPSGTVCGSGQVCDGEGNCQIQGGCLIGGTNYTAGATNPNGACQECNPNVSMNSWSFKASTSQCRAAAGACDVAEYCTGNSATCPADGKRSATTVCHSSTGVCDVAEYCTGSGNNCPDDGYLANGTGCDTNPGAWGNCEGFSDYCDATGTQSRTITVSTCGGGSCNPSSAYAETQECLRIPPPQSCSGPSYGDWSSCGGFSDECSTVGTQSRTVTHYNYDCASGQCVASTSIESQECARDTEGNYCGINGSGHSYCHSGVCQCEGTLCEQCQGGVCFMVCIETNHDFNNCGGCGHICEQGDVQCNDGHCSGGR